MTDGSKLRLRSLEETKQGRAVKWFVSIDHSDFILTELNRNAKLFVDDSYSLMYSMGKYICGGVFYDKRRLSIGYIQK